MHLPPLQKKKCLKNIKINFVYEYCCLSSLRWKLHFTYSIYVGMQVLYKKQLHTWGDAKTFTNNLTNKKFSNFCFLQNIFLNIQFVGVEK